MSGRTDTARMEWIEKHCIEFSVSMQQGGHNDGLIYVDTARETYCGATVRKAIDEAMDAEERG